MTQTDIAFDQLAIPCVTDNPRAADAHAPERLRQLAQERERSLDALAERRAAVIAKALDVARMLIATRGSVTGPLLIQAMRTHGYGNLIDGLDPRWTGAVLRPCEGFRRTGETIPAGSKGRHVPVWVLA